MTIKNKSIWHTPQEEMPDHNIGIVFYTDSYPKFGWYDANDASFNDYYTCLYYETDSVHRWAYLDDLVSASKALDVACKALLEINGYDIRKADNNTVRNICDDCLYIAGSALEKIDKYMKGDK